MTEKSADEDIIDVKASEVFTKKFLLKIVFYIMIMCIFIFVGILIGQERSMQQSYNIAMGLAENYTRTYCTDAVTHGAYLPNLNMIRIQEQGFLNESQ